MTDNINHPQHYQLPGLPCESIDVIRAVLGDEGFCKFCRGNALKYLIRADHKGGTEDLEKARVYLNWEIGDEQEGTTEESSEVIVKEPTKESDAIRAAELIKGYCRGFGECNGCIFNYPDAVTNCELLALVPYHWLTKKGEDAE